MISYYFNKKNKEIITIKIIGHSLYNIKNNDIVCASVSTAIILTLNILKMLDLQQNIIYSLREGFFKLTVLNKKRIIIILLNNLEYSLRELEKNYGKYIKEFLG